MNSQIIKDEVGALRSILYGDDEFQILAHDEEEVVILVTPLRLKGQHVTLSATLYSTKYPWEAPKLSIQSTQLKRKEVASVQVYLEDQAEKLKGEAMILNLVDSLVDYISSMDSSNKAACESTNSCELSKTVIIHLDHIRSRQTYVKTLTKWFQELGLIGLLVHYKRLVLLMVSGNKNNIQVYLKRHRTQIVDVDSAGRPCKERLLSVLGEVGESLESFTSSCLEQTDFDDRDAYVRFWKGNATLWNIYQKFILPHSEQKKLTI